MVSHSRSCQLLPLLALFVTASCGSSGSPSSTPTPPAAKERFPEAPAAACLNIPVIGEDIEIHNVVPAETVAIDGVPTVGPRVCTTMLCKKPCCNSCSGSYVVTIAVQRTATAVALTGIPGCSGNECHFDCEPFGIEPATPYRFVGKITESDGAGARYTLDVETFCKLSEPESPTP